MNTAGLRGYAADFGRAIDGWIYVDMHSDSNQTLHALLAALRRARRESLAAAKGFDLGRLVAEGSGTRDLTNARRHQRKVSNK